jgi:hypothetical protein
VCGALLMLAMTGVCTYGCNGLCMHRFDGYLNLYYSASDFVFLAINWREL